jgi:hypothetical protein
VQADVADNPPKRGGQSATGKPETKARRAAVATTVSAAGITAGPSEKYRIIYADPPWDYGAHAQPDYQTEQRDHYPVMTVEAICAEPVKQWVEADAVLFLWVTSPILEKAFGVVRAGIEPRFENRQPGDVLAMIVSLNRKRRMLRASQSAIAAAEAWRYATSNGQVAERGEIGRNRSLKVSDLIKDPRKHFAALFGVNFVYVQQARALLADDPVAAASVGQASPSLFALSRFVRFVGRLMQATICFGDSATCRSPCAAPAWPPAGRSFRGVAHLGQRGL